MANIFPYSQVSKNEITMVGSRTFEEFVEEVRRFHSYPAPGVVLGGFMVEKAKTYMPEGVLYNAIAETFSCLADAIQLLTPCTIGNGWLKIIHLGHFALSLCDKSTGEGVRISIDYNRLARYSEIKSWFFKLKPKNEQNEDKLMEEIREAGSWILRTSAVSVNTNDLVLAKKKGVILCPSCGEAYPIEYGPSCMGCQGKGPYVRWSR
jgi:formylmethanofuran dehydrogenase subunit E